MCNVSGGFLHMPVDELRFLLLLIKINFLLKKKVLCIVYGMERSFQVCIWFGTLV